MADYGWVGSSILGGQLGPEFSRGHPTPLHHSGLNGECKVADFINPSSREWKVDLLSNLISENERDVIAQLYVGPAIEPDKLIWSFDRKGCYSVRSGYWRCHSGHPILRSDRPSSSIFVDPRVWTWI
ncbi:hypothetical protein FF1_046644 [Malus domestica]